MRKKYDEKIQKRREKCVCENVPHRTLSPLPPSISLSLIKSQGYSSKLKFITREIAVFRCRYTDAVVEATAVD